MSKVLTIERSRWRRGGDSVFLVELYGHSQMLNAEGYMCCLGFDALACGVSRNQIDDIGEPYDVKRAPKAYRNTRMSEQYSPVVSEAMSANDDPNLSEPEREAAVRAALLKLGWEDVVFVD